MIDGGYTRDRVGGCVFEKIHTFPNIKLFSDLIQEVSQISHPTLRDIPLSTPPPIQKRVVSVCERERDQERDRKEKKENIEG